MFAVTIDNEVLTQVGTWMGSFAGILGSGWLAWRYARLILASVRLAMLGVVVGSLMLTGYGAARWINSTNFDNKVRDYVVAAYRADSPDRAKKYLDNAIAYLKDTGRHKGYTSLFAGAQADDLEEWCNDLTAVRDGLDKPTTISPDTLASTDPMPKADSTTADVPTTLNPLFKDKDAKEPKEPKEPWWKKRLEAKFIAMKGDKVEGIRSPEGISMAPYNVHYAGGLTGGIGVTLLSLCWLGIAFLTRPPTALQLAEARCNTLQLQVNAVNSNFYNSQAQLNARSNELKNKETECANLKVQVDSLQTVGIQQAKEQAAVQATLDETATELSNAHRDRDNLRTQVRKLEEAAYQRSVCGNCGKVTDPPKTGTGCVFDAPKPGASGV